MSEPRPPVAAVTSAVITCCWGCGAGGAWSFDFPTDGSSGVNAGLPARFLARVEASGVLRSLSAFSGQCSLISGFEFIFKLFQGLSFAFRHVGPEEEETRDAEGDEDEEGP